ncbi:hypothetical protein ICL16_27835 [Iningainema sp. BLCCT55]|uniref:DUF2269 domain-containing protein n=2 Tax=Iningainema TaxID=1932705 RepID=A0A8J6XMR4_9CYAN|nr:hypothetical protein [Iningainema tapete]MBD2775766.1 hypothetical protein [Iningainema tapete BLCC-T55]
MPKSNVKEKAPKLSVKQKNWLLTFHVSFAALWTGTVLSMLLLAWRNQHSTNPDILYALNSAINLLDDFVVIPSAIGSLVTGTLLCWLTVWGFFKFYWVIAKWIATVFLIVFGTFWLFPWANTATAISQEQKLQALQNPLYMFDVRGVLIGTLVQVLCLLAIIGISFLKPWGRRLVKEQSQAKSVTAN